MYGQRFAYYLTHGITVRDYAFGQHDHAHRSPKSTCVYSLDVSNCLPFAYRRTAGTIAHILGTLDDKIELNRRMNETLEEMARALFKSWFVDFDPVRAKMEGRWRRGDSLPGMPAELYDLLPRWDGRLGVGGDSGRGGW